MLRPDFGAEACELTIRGTPLGATTGRSQASAPQDSPGFAAFKQASELAGLVRPQGCPPAEPASPAGGQVANPQTVATTSWEDHEFRNPGRTKKSKRKARRRTAFEIRDGLRPISIPRVAGCGHRRIAAHVEVSRRLEKRADGLANQRATYRGLLRCGSVWECPVCASQIRTQRALELEEAVEVWGASCVAMLSLTVRHGFGDNLKQSRRGVSGSFSRLIRGAPWKRFCSKLELKHHVRALEVTHGPEHGWHPHLHVLFFLDDAPSEELLAEATEWLRARWAVCVRRALGKEFVPNSHGVDLRLSKRADYLVKSGWELLDPGAKRGRGRNRTPLQIATAAALNKRPEDQALWTTYCDDMRGAKMLTWSTGSRKELGLGEERSDQEIVGVEEEQSEAEPVAIIDGATWDRVRHRPGLACTILEVVERAAGATAGFEGVQELLRDRKRSGADPPVRGCL